MNLYCFCKKKILSLTSIFFITFLLIKNKMNEFEQLIKIIETLRAPDTGCPWDKVQTKKSLKEYIIEEAYELIEAIDKEDISNIEEELGDLLLQIIFVSQIMKEKGESSISEVIKNLNRKLIRRHPHIFSDSIADTPAEVKNNWEKIKKKKKRKRVYFLITRFPCLHYPLQKDMGNRLHLWDLTGGLPVPPLIKFRKNWMNCDRKLKHQIKKRSPKNLAISFFPLQMWPGSQELIRNSL